MAFRDHLAAAQIESEPVSIIHGLWEHSRASNHALTVFDNLIETPGHRAAVNILTRDRLCQAIGITPEEYIDTLGWAMANPSEPVIVDASEAECFDNIQER